jgi:hypothetical protein
MRELEDDALWKHRDDADTTAEIGSWDSPMIHVA